MMGKAEPEAMKNARVQVFDCTAHDRGTLVFDIASKSYPQNSKVLLYRRYLHA
jgi:hypothetical protein